MSNEFLEALPDDVMVPFKDDKGTETQIKLKEHPSAAKFKDAGSVLKSYIEVERQLGGRIAIPGKDAKPEEIQAFRTKIGVPEKLDGYKLTDIKDLHKNLKVTPESMKPFLEVAHAAGVTNEAADKLNQWFLKQVSDQLTAQETKNTADLAAAQGELTKEWGDKFNDNLQAATKFAQLLGGEKVQDSLGNLGNNPVLLRMLHKASTVISEDAILKLNTGGGGGGNGDPKKEAAAKISAIIGLQGPDRSKHPYFNENDPKHHDTVKEVRELYKLAYTD